MAALSHPPKPLRQNWPARPVTLVVTFAAGSGDDVLTRIIAPHLSEILGQQFVVEDVGGAGGMNGTSRVARGNPDGYEAVVGGTGTFAANQTLYKHPSYNALTDFTPVGLVAEQPLILVLRVRISPPTISSNLSPTPRPITPISICSAAQAPQRISVACCSTLRLVLT